MNPSILPSIPHCSSTQCARNTALLPSLTVPQLYKQRSKPNDGQEHRAHQSEAMDRGIDPAEAFLGDVRRDLDRRVGRVGYEYHQFTGGIHDAPRKGGSMTW